MDRHCAVAVIDLIDGKEQQVISMSDQPLRLEVRTEATVTALGNSSPACDTSISDPCSVSKVPHSFPENSHIFTPQLNPSSKEYAKSASSTANAGPGARTCALPLPFPESLS